MVEDLNHHSINFDCGVLDLMVDKLSIYIYVCVWHYIHDHDARH